jgi:hypothetical protein
MILYQIADLEPTAIHIEVTDFLYLVEAEVVFMCAIKSIAYNSILTWPRSVSDVEQELYIFTGHM